MTRIMYTRSSDTLNYRKRGWQKTTFFTKRTLYYKGLFYVQRPLGSILCTRDLSYVYHTFPQNLILQVNEKGHIGIVEKAQETSSDSDMHTTVCLCHCCTS